MSEIRCQMSDKIRNLMSEIRCLESVETIRRSVQMSDIRFQISDKNLSDIRSLISEIRAYDIVRTAWRHAEASRNVLPSNNFQFSVLNSQIIFNESIFIGN